MSEANKVRCSECGFLSGNHSGSYEMIEVPKEFRDGRELARFAPVPICPMGQIDFRKASGDYTSQKMIAEEIQKERDCSKFTKWVPGMSPKDHIHMSAFERVMMIGDRAEQASREFALRSEERERQRDKFDAERYAREIETLKIESGIRKWEVFWMSLIVLAVSSAVQILAAYISKGK